MVESFPAWPLGIVLSGCLSILTPKQLLDKQPHRSLTPLLFLLVVVWLLLDLASSLIVMRRCVRGAPCCIFHSRLSLGWNSLFTETAMCGQGSASSP